jgi:hypothetical protein
MQREPRFLMMTIVTALPYQVRLQNFQNAASGRQPQCQEARVIVRAFRVLVSGANLHCTHPRWNSVFVAACFIQSP